MKLSLGMISVIIESIDESEIGVSNVFLLDTLYIDKGDSKE